jgi:hypothetical protein
MHHIRTLSRRSGQSAASAASELPERRTRIRTPQAGAVELPMSGVEIRLKFCFGILFLA